MTVLDNFEPYYDLDIKERNVDGGRTVADEFGSTYDLEGAITDADLIDDLVSEADVVSHQAAPQSLTQFGR